MPRSRKRRNVKKLVQAIPVQKTIQVGETKLKDDKGKIVKDKDGKPVMEPVLVKFKTKEIKFVKHSPTK